MVNKAKNDPIPLERLEAFLEGSNLSFTVKGARRDFFDIAPFDKSRVGDLVWSRTVKFDPASNPANVFLLPAALQSDITAPEEKTLVFVDHPREVFRQILNGLFSDRYNAICGFGDAALFEQSFPTGQRGQGARIASNVKLGKNVILHPNVVLYPNVSLGDNVEVGAGSVIGAPGYGYVRQPDNSLAHFPHIGGVVIEDDVTIGANTCIDSGGLSPTRIGRGSKIGNLCQIAHNTEIGEDCLLAGRVQIGGGTKVGARTEIWPSTILSHKLVVGAECDIKIGSVVVTNLPDGAIVSGNFAVSHEKNLRDFARKRN